MIPSNIIDSILQAADMVQLVNSAGVKLHKAGRLWKGCCPFHDEKTPSFVVYENTQTYKCFGCGEGGNAFSFLMKKKNMTFIEAVRELAAQYHITIEEEQLTPEQAQAEKEKESLRVIYEAAGSYFHQKLIASIQSSDKIGQYATGRFSEETIKNFKIGYADSEWQSLWNYMKEKGFLEELLLKSDLFRESNGRVYDFFRSRLVFPMFDRVGRIIGFSGRDLTGEKNVAKYQNSSETPIYHKGETLYGLNFAIPAIRKYDVAILVEGNPDVVKMHEHGVNNVVAACGTALTETQIKTIAKYTKNFCLLYDGDAAGVKATKKNAEIIINLGYNPLVLSIPAGEDGSKQDPDTFFKDRDDFKNFYLQKAEPFVVYLAKSKKENCRNNAPLAAKTAAEIARLFYKKTESERTALVEELAKHIKTKKVWNDALKQLDNADKQIEKEAEAKKKATPVYLQDNGRTNEQNKSIEKYGFYVENNSYHFIHQKSGSVFIQGSNFILEPLFHIESTINAKRLYKITNEYGITRVMEFPQRDLISIAAFKLRCESVGNFRFEAGDYGLGKIKAYLYEKTKTCKEITQLGWQSKGFWAWSNGIVKNGEFEKVTDDGICTYENENYYIPALSSFYASDELLFQFERKFKHAAGAISFRKYFAKFNKVYGENAIIGIGFYLAALFRDIIVSYYKSFPIMNLFGPKGTGKSQMAISLLQLFGHLPVGINMVNSTIAAMADHVSHTKNAICHIDEYKNNVDYDKIEFLKGLFDGTGRNRMNMDKDKKKEMTAVDSAILLTGQEMTTADIALFSRVIFLSFSKSKFTDSEKLNYNELKNIEDEGLTQITNEILQHRSFFVANFKENFDAAASEIAQIIDKNSIEDRIYRNWVILLASIRTLKEKVELPMPYQGILMTFAPLIKRQNEETKKNNEVSNFWDIFTYLVREGVIEKDYDYRIDHVRKLKTDKIDAEGNKIVIQIDFIRISQMYAKHSKMTSQKLLPTETLKYYLENSPEYLGVKTSRMKRRVNLLQNRETAKQFEGDGSEARVETFSVKVRCFDYEKLDIDVMTFYTQTEKDGKLEETEE